jgi:Na+/citrate or Na+/malate symporter
MNDVGTAEYSVYGDGAAWRMKREVTVLNRSAKESKIKFDDMAYGSLITITTL